MILVESLNSLTLAFETALRRPHQDYTEASPRKARNLRRFINSLRESGKRKRFAKGPSWQLNYDDVARMNSNELK